jgi:hypothetical protein
MLKFAGIKPIERRGFLEAVVARPHLGGFAADPTLKAFGIEVEAQLVRVAGRQLPQPKLAYDSSTAVDPGNKVCVFARATGGLFLRVCVVCARGGAGLVFASVCQHPRYTHARQQHALTPNNKQHTTKKSQRNTTKTHTTTPL